MLVKECKGLGKLQTFQARTCWKPAKAEHKKLSADIKAAKYIVNDLFLSSSCTPALQPMLPEKHTVSHPPPQYVQLKIYRVCKVNAKWWKPNVQCIYQTQWVHVLQQIAYFIFFLQACSFNVRKNFTRNYYWSGYFPQVDTTGRLCLCAQFKPKRITENLLLSYEMQ